MSASINKIQLTSSTGLSLSERFTAVQDQRREIPERITRPPSRDSNASNRRLLQQLARRHKLQAALKLKRRSMRLRGRNMAKRRNSIKAHRVAANGKPIRSRDSLIGGAAQRIARLQNRGRSRSRSRAPVAMINLTRSRSHSGGRVRPQMTGRSRSRINQQHSRSRINKSGARDNIPVKARLGVRPGVVARRRRSANALRGVAEGRIQRRRISNMGAGAGGRVGRQRGRSATRNANAVGGRSRSNIRNGAQIRTQSRTQSYTQSRTQSRAQSRTRSRASGKSLGGQRNNGSVQNGRARGRSQQRRGGRSAGAQRNGKANGNKNNQQQQQQHRRERSRTRVGRGGRYQGKNSKPKVDKDMLDKELDLYMATARTD